MWTSGIGHTAGVVPKGEITERQAAANLVADVMNVEKRLAVCAPVEMPQQVYDALVSFSFNVGTGAACRSTLVSYIKRHQWWQACDQLTRWVYVNGSINKGLENRRARERAYCIRGDSMKVMLFLLAALMAVVLWQRHENGNLMRSFERANKVAVEQKNVIGMLKNQLSVSRNCQEKRNRAGHFTR